MGNCLNRDYCDLVIFVILEGMGNCLNRDNPLNPPYQGNKKEHFSRQMEFMLTTRKIMFGMLLVLVLAFSVQSQQEQRVEIQVPRTVSGFPGGTETLTIIASEKAFVRVGSSDDTFPLGNSSNPIQSGTIYRSTLTLPRRTGTYSLSVFIENTRYPVTVSVTATPVETGALTVRVDPFSGAPGKTATVTVTATDSNNRLANVTVTLTATGGTLSTSAVTTGTDGTETVTLTRGSTAGNENYVIASATNYDLVSSRFLISEAPPVTPPPAGEPDALAIQDGNDQSGALNTPLAEPFVVKVVDAYDDPAKDVRVRFRVTQGSGSLSSRTPLTDKDGLAETTFTPTSTGLLRAVATIPGVDDTVTFYIGVQAEEPVKVPVSTSIVPKVLVNAVNRPAMLWVDGGRIYALVGADVKEEFVQGIHNAMNVTVDASGGKIYWTAQTGPSAGTINAANLDGTGATVLTSILAAPIGIAVDTAGSKLYWTNSRGRIQRANLDGSGIRNVLENLPGSPMDIALSGGNAYWTQDDGSVRFVNLRGQKVVHDISTGSDTPGSLAIANGKVYWTEMAAESGGTINSANLDGTGVTELRSILAAPSGIAVDTARSKLYWTNASGRIQSANLNGSGIKNVVDGLGSPGEIVVSNNITETLAAGAPTAVGLKRNRIQEQINLQQILMTTRPEKTQLLANYPNPFNPETWIPYELATDTHVTITIYNTQGVVIRTLQFGHQSAGYYTERDRAAYWDGRNALGEQVASGLYFYQLETDAMSSMRKMVILK